MAVLWMDDPSFYNLTEMGVRYASLSISTSIGSGTGRFGNNSWHGVSSGATQFFQNVATIVTGTIGISFKCSALPNGGISNVEILGFYDSGTLQCDLRLNASGTLFVTRNGTQIGSTSTNALSPNVWYRIEMKLTVDPSAGVIEVHVNGSSTGWIPSTGSLNTRNTANTSFNQISIGSVGNQSYTSDFNDLVFTDTNSPNANFQGDVRTYLRFPNGNSSVAWTNTWASWTASTVMAIGQQIKDSNGNVQQVTAITSDDKTGATVPVWATTGGLTTTDNHVTWTVIGTGANPGAANWMAVSENPSDGDNSYNLSATPTQVDLFTLPNLPSGVGTIIAVDNVIYCRKDDAGTRTISNEIKSSTTVANGSNLNLSTSYQYNDFINNTDPNTSTAWTTAGANALLVGYDEVA